MSGLEGYAPHPPAATVQKTIQDSLIHKEKEHIKQPSHVSFTLRMLTWHEGNHVSGPCLCLIFCVLTSGSCMRTTRKRAPTRGTKTQACPTLLGVSAVTTTRPVTRLRVELPIARVASLLLPRLSLKRLNRFELKYIWVQIYLNFPYSNRE